ncbi:nucleoside triphosphate pyrophosphohydrolase [Lolliginicoccus levis]|uniref:nucleoside triphosphate pyrophosphohydrolase n=1 Tax=Lolliginicoccus levis TaxID=2919542 RepID=UPI00241E17BC|nr:nucleoside triphosphate pyrophosphohydrolase [Lolliginicoccus levis]
MGKLVRDKIPAIIRASGGDPVTRVLGAREYEQALRDKLVEETTELREADTADDRIAEAADVLEVLTALVALDGHDLADIVEAARHKAAHRGGFVDRTWLEQA